jgi:hypothetical protein
MRADIKSQEIIESHLRILQAIEELKVRLERKKRNVLKNKIPFGLTMGPMKRQKC